MNRFVQRPIATVRKRDAQPEQLPVFLEVGTDWARGSSGAAVLDLCGNAVGHVATIESIVDEGDPSQRKGGLLPGIVIVFHDAICARHVKELVREK